MLGYGELTAEEQRAQRNGKKYFVLFGYELILSIRLAATRPPRRAVVAGFI
ncbi:MAG: hypothetical protein MIO93_02745 [ANME-2 cluster archaeon]|jgi:hypothetical protein|nr:hypothetical protein [ANME-2 cluster archaeon]